MAGWVDTVFKFLGYGRYNTTLPSVVAGAAEELQLDSRGRLIVSVGAQTALNPTGLVTYSDGALVSGVRTVTMNASKRFYGARCASSYASSRYFQIHDLALAASLVSTTSIPVYSIYLPTLTQVEIVIPRGRVMVNGLVFAMSTTSAVYTLDGSATAWTNAEMDAG